MRKALVDVPVVTTPQMPSASTPTNIVTHSKIRPLLASLLLVFRTSFILEHRL
jgi:hypothetical protein